MTETRKRRTGNGREVEVGRNNGLRKLCACDRRVWAKCPHSWHFSFTWRGTSYRFSLDRHLGRHVASKTDAMAHAEATRVAIRGGQFALPATPRPSAPPTPEPAPVTFAELADKWLTRERLGKVATAADDVYRVKQLNGIEIAPGAFLSNKAVTRITEDDLEAAFDVLRVRGVAEHTANHYVQTLKSIEKWAVRKAYLTRPWLTEGTSVRRHKGVQRNRRLVADILDGKGLVIEPGEERRLLAASNPWLQRLIIAALETGCRKGELLSLQWRDVDLQRGVFTVRAENSKTRSRRVLPISPRLKGVLEMVMTGPDGRDHAPTAFVFGNELGERVADPKTAWQIAVLRAHGHEPTYRRKGNNSLDAASRAAYREINLHFHDLRHEAASRLLEAGWPVHHVQEMLGHANVKTTSTYLNVTAEGLAESMRRFGTLQILAKRPARERRPACKSLAPDQAQGTVN